MDPTLTRGKFIVFEGVEGAGKTTMIEKAHAQFPDAVITHEPGGTPFAEKIRKLIVSEEALEVDTKTLFSLFWAARADDMARTILPALESGRHVFCDRGDGSTYAYQIVAQEGADLKELFYHTRQVYLGDATPDMYILLDVDPTIGLARTRSRNKELTYFDQKEIMFHRRVRDGYHDFLRDKPHETIDASRVVEETWVDVHEAIFKALR